MNHLIVYSHPNSTSFNRAILDTVVAESKLKGHNIQIRDLYALNFNPVLSSADLAAVEGGQVSDDIRIEQEFIRNADVITFIFPIWWTQMPALLKGYIDRVFSYGFAYTYTDRISEGLLKGKKVFVFNTQNTPEALYEAKGMYQSLKQTTDDGIFRFCGMTVMEHRFFAAVPWVTSHERAQMIEQVKRDIRIL